MTRQELIDLAREIGAISMIEALSVQGLEKFTNAILERAAQEFSQTHVQTCGAEIQEVIRSLKVNDVNKEH